jgi:F-type H+-transporting ATPase subunit gamma
VIRRSLAVAAEHRGAGRQVHWLAVGRKGSSSLRFRGQEIEASYTGITDRPTYADARAIAERVAELYTQGEIDLVVMVYNRFVSALTQALETVEVLPVPEELLAGDEEAEVIQGAYLEEPDRSEILRRLLPTYVEVTIYRALLESTASEHGSRMTAMGNASENASKLIDSLTLEMNRARQAEITQQILEVVAGADALE